MVVEERKIDALAPNVFAEFIGDNFGSDNIVLSGANVSHEELVNLANSTLGSLTPKKLLREANYTGGNVSISADGPAHVAIGLKGVSWNADDLVPACVLYTLLGGGGSFSSGGPGKGMYTRLYSDVLSPYPWISSCTSFNHCYADTGLFGIHASCNNPGNINNLIEVVGTQMNKLASPPTAEELERAKAMTKSSLVMNLESRGIVCEDIGRQILSSGKYVTAEELVKRIEKVTQDDILKVGTEMLQSKLSIVKYGEEYASYNFELIESAMKAQAKKIKA